MDTTNILEERLNTYIENQNKIGEPCSIDRFLQIVSECVADILQSGQKASVELHHFEPYTTVIITIPGDSALAQHGPYTFKIRTS